MDEFVYIVYKNKQVAFREVNPYCSPPNTVYTFSGIEALESVLRAPESDRVQLTDINGKPLKDSRPISIMEFKKQLNESMNIHTSNMGRMNNLLGKGK
jgi:hypothetical protein